MATHMPTKAPATAPSYTRSNPFPGKMTVNRPLNPGSEKDTRHLEIDVTGWGLGYEVGESIAVYPSNDPQLVERDHQSDSRER